MSEHFSLVLCFTISNEGEVPFVHLPVGAHHTRIWRPELRLCDPERSGLGVRSDRAKVTRLRDAKARDSV